MGGGIRKIRATDTFGKKSVTGEENWLDGVSPAMAGDGEKTTGAWCVAWGMNYLEGGIAEREDLAVFEEKIYGWVMRAAAGGRPYGIGPI